MRPRRVPRNCKAEILDTAANRARDPKANRSQWVQPSQVAALLVHLASDAGAQITGAATPIYGRQL